jgi:hypothetical protein
MSGDNIYMDYYSVLGPIDPQVRNKDGRMVSASGYLDKVNGMMLKAQNDQLSQAEFHILKDFDLAELRGYEQAVELNTGLLKKWLVKYKFKNWIIHESTGEPVTEREKAEFAEEIAGELSKSLWHTHTRPIGIRELKAMGLSVTDYSEDDLKDDIDCYYGLLSDYITRNEAEIYFHTRRFAG